MAVVTHMSKVVTRKFRSGGEMTITGTLCNRMSNAADDLNCEFEESLVTCKLCLKQLNRLRIRAKLEQK